ncbi:MAG TPA: Flp pilus assembly protein CpaB [Gaiellaceae bacterium]|nr:Flp pilus assembly protein CpaB [Gaiellaceae bacterium]
MNISYKTRNLLIAALLGLVAAAITLAYTASSKHEAKTTTGTGTQTVLVATRDIPIGTAGSRLQGAGWVRVVKVAQGDAAAGAVVRPSELSKLVAVQPTYRGEQIVTRRFGATQQEGLPSVLHGAQRVYELPGDAHQVLAGTLKSGNHVDVVGSVRNPESDGNHYSKVVIHDLLVVTAADKPSGASANDLAPVSVDLVVTTDQAQRLFWLQKNADWTLVLRPSTGAADGSSQPASAASVLGGNRG